MDLPSLPWLLDAAASSLLDPLEPIDLASRPPPLILAPSSATLMPRPAPLSLAPRSFHPELSLTFAPASFSSASDILSFGSSSDEDDDDGQGMRIDDIEEEQESSTEDESGPWRPCVHSRGSDESDAGARSLSASAEDDARHRPPLRGRRSRDLSSESTAALLIRQHQQSSHESKCWLGGGRDGPLPSHRPSPSPGQPTTIAGRLAPPSPSTSGSSSPERPRRRSRSRSFRRPGSPILESATSASDDSPPRAGEPDSASSSLRASSPIATPTPPGRSVRFNPRMKTRTAYGSYQSDRSIDLVSASPAASFLAWRYPRNARAMSAKRAPAVASWKAYYGSLDSGGGGVSSFSQWSYPAQGPALTSASAAGRGKDDDPLTAADFGASIWERLCRPSYWRWKAGLDDWAEGGCCALPDWSVDDDDSWSVTNDAAGDGLSASHRRPGGGLGFGEGRPGGMF